MIFSDIEVLFLKRLINIISSIILLILILIIIVIFAPKLFSIEPMVVVSGSMEPSYMKGSLLYVKESAGGIQTGDVITFYRNGELVTHRVVEINTDEKTYITKGDANQVNDVQPVAWSDVVGVPVFDIPVLGYPASFRLPYCNLPFYFFDAVNFDDEYLACFGILNKRKAKIMHPVMLRNVQNLCNHPVFNRNSINIILPITSKSTPCIVC